MYCLTDQQVDYILDDIRRNGIEMEDLQLNLLDHICCIVEQNLKEGDDFEDFYKTTIRQFYKHELREIEEETIQLLTFKNYYVMKKVMMVTGTISVLAFITGSLFKIMHWPGAAVLLFLGIISVCFVFLPLMFLLKVRELNTTGEKLTLAAGMFTGILFCMATLFTVMHWPGARILWFSGFIVSFFVFIPLYFFTGFGKPERKMNTIITSIVLIGGTGLLFTMMNLRPTDSQNEIKMHNYVQNEQLLKAMQQRLQTFAAPEVQQNPLVADINSMCEEIKTSILQRAIGMPEVPADYDARQLYISESNLGPDFYDSKSGVQLFAKLKNAVMQYNAAHKDRAIPIEHSVLKADPERVGRYTNLSMLNSLTQVQMFLVNAETPMIASK